MCKLLIVAFVRVLESLETLVDIQFSIAQCLQQRLLVVLFTIFAVYVKILLVLARTIYQKVC